MMHVDHEEEMEEKGKESANAIAVELDWQDFDEEILRTLDPDVVFAADVVPNTQFKKKNNNNNKKIV